MGEEPTKGCGHDPCQKGIWDEGWMTGLREGRAESASLRARVAEMERERDSRLDEELDVIGQLPQKNARIATLERDLAAARSDAQYWRESAPNRDAEYWRDTAQGLGIACFDAERERDAALAQVQAMREALELTQHAATGSWADGWTVYLTGHQMNAIRDALGIPR